MATGTGLDGQFGFAAESTWGTAVTVTKFIEFDSENIKFDPTWLEPTGLRPGLKYKRASRVRQSRKSVAGPLTFEHPTKGALLLLKHMTGSSATAPTQISATTAYKTNFQPGDYRGLGLTLQVGRPEASSGTVRPFTWAGCKVSGWEFSCEDNSIPTWKIDILGRSEATATALATASYVSGAAVFDFSQATLKLGGTASTASGEVSIASGVSVATVVRSFNIKSSVPMAEERFGLGNAGLRSEPLENDIPILTGSLDCEFNKTEFYDVFQANTTQPMQFTLSGAAIGASGHNFTLDFTLAATKLKNAEPAVSGPDIVRMSTDFEVYSDETNAVYQIQVKSDETTF